MIDRTHDLSISRQAELVGISRGSVYYHPDPIPESDLRLMRRIDELHLEHPFAGSRMLRDLLRQEGVEVGRRHVGTLMKRMGIEALYRKPNTSRKHPRHPVHPYLLRGLAIEHANQVWALDTTYIPMARGFVYLTAVVDVFSRRALAHRVAITLEPSHAVEALEEALVRFGPPEIVNTDQGNLLKKAGLTRSLYNQIANYAYTQEEINVTVRESAFLDDAGGLGQRSTTCWRSA